MKVLRYWTNQGEDLAYTIVEPVAFPVSGAHPLMHFSHDGFQVPISAYSVKELKAKLREMLKACDEPMLHLTPGRVIPADVCDA